MRSSLKVVALLSVLFVVGLLTGCGVTSIGPGHAGIIVSRAGSDRGVLSQTATTGWVFYNPLSKSVIEYQTSMRCVSWTADPNEGRKNVNEEISFTNKDSMVIKTNLGVCFSLDPNRIPRFYVKFLARSEDDLDTKFTYGYLRNTVRNCMNDYAGQYSIAQIMGDNAQFLKDSHKCIQDDVGQYGAQIDQFGLLGAPRPPQAVIDAINAKVQAEQVVRQKQMEVAQVEADAKKRVAEADGEAQAITAMANAQAGANRKIAESLSDNLIRYKAIEKWNGARPTVEGVGSGLILNVK